MAVENNLCETCNHAHLCIYKKYIDRFSSDVKRPLGIDIKMEKCDSYKKKIDKGEKI